MCMRVPLLAYTATQWTFNEVHKDAVKLVNMLYTHV